MHIKTLKIFCDTVSLRSFSRAADENGVSQSNASQVIHQLEERLGVSLIDRSTRPFGLTQEGDRFYDGCRDIVRRYFDLEREVQSLHEAVASRLSVASIYSVGLAHMSQCLHEFRAAYPKAEVRVEYLHPNRVYEVVESGEADLGLVGYPETSRRIGAIAWRDESLALVVAPTHPLAELDQAPLEAIDGQTMVALERGIQMRAEIDRELARRKIEVKVAFEFDNIETLKRSIEINDGVALLPEPTVAREVANGSLVRIPLIGNPLVRPLAVIYRKTRPFSKTAEQFISLLQSHANDANEPPQKINKPPELAQAFA